MTRKRDRGQPPQTAGRDRRRTFLGDEPWLEILNKLATLAALGFGVWAYFNTVEPVFEIQRRLAEERQRAGLLAHEVAGLKSERAALLQRLAEYPGYRRGIVLSYLIDVKKDLQREAAIYQRLAPAGFDLREHSLARVDAALKRLGSPASGSIQSYQKEALEFVRRFVDETIPAGATKVDVLDEVLDAYVRQEAAGGEGRR